MDDPTRSTLLQRLRDRADTDAWAVFDSLYYPLVVAYARSRGLSDADARDTAQQCSQAVVERIGEYQHLGSFKAWLRAIADHKIVDRRRRLSREVQPASGFWPAHDDPSPSPADAWDRAWLRAHVAYCAKRARQGVSESTYEAFEACVVRGVAPSDVATALNISVNQVYVAKHRVLERIRALLREVHGDEEVL